MCYKRIVRGILCNCFMKKKTYLAVMSILLIKIVSAQAPDSKLRNYHPVSPTAFQFLKYDEMPVSEYTGVPDISIPLYQIEEDGVKVPVTLTYHAGGIRVSQEASWAGLGWDMNFGSIVQEINDIDDYSPYTNIVKLRPDYKWSPYPTYFPTRYTIPNCLNTTGNGWSNPYPITPFEGKSSYMIATANWIPLNGNFNNQLLGESVLSATTYDSEPDIFTANFFGHSIKFMRDFNSGNIIILNKKGYKVTRTGDSFIIGTPSGDDFYFEIKSSVIANTESNGGQMTGSFTNYDPSSAIWMLTKIITSNKKQVLFNYSQSLTVNNYPSYSEKLNIYANPHSENHNIHYSVLPNVEGFSNLLINGTLPFKTYYHSTEKRYFINSIIFPEGQINFSLSDRNDLTGGKKIDAVQIASAGQLIKSYSFNYSYFDASSVGGNTSAPPYNAAVFGNMPNLRLKLLSLQDNSGAVYNFNYNPTQLPSKISYAQDFWGYYNGRLTNTSLIPNPARLKIPGLGDNGNNNSSNLAYAQAGILTSIQYPTGGKTSFEYELNQFDNYWAPDFNDINNQVSSGNGLRIHAVNFLNSINEVAKRTIYNYYGGKSITPFNVYRNFTATDIKLFTSENLQSTTYTVHELNGKGFFSSNALGSINGVGYDKVIKTDVTANGVDNGRVETLFNNTPDKFYNSSALPDQLGAALPTNKNENFPENGTSRSISIYTKDNKLLRKIENSYSTTQSGLYYGARIFGYSSLFFVEKGCLIDFNSPPYWSSVPQSLIGYYPIYDIESVPSSVTTTEYDENNNNITTTNNYYYDAFNLLNTQSTYTSSAGTPGTASQVVTYYTHPYDDQNVAGNQALLQQHRYDEVVKAKKTIIKGATGQSPVFTDYSKVDNEYISIGDKVVKNKTTATLFVDAASIPSITTYNKYDAGNANLLEYTDKGITNSMIWDYSGNYLVAEIKNATYSNTAYTSFEGTYTGDAGNWQLQNNTTVGDATAPTGKKCYTLSAGKTLLKNGLVSSVQYVVSYWSKNGSYSVAGSTGLITGKTINGWTYYEHAVSNTTTVTVSGNGSIDEVRLYPKGALMDTYTYQPLVGITSQCDANNKLTFFEYDPYQRLKLIRDQNKNIIKQYDYQYQAVMPQ
jgi:hypothetical protein